NESISCSEFGPLCFVGVNRKCERNHSDGRWHHHSFGEHICRNCLKFFRNINKCNSGTDIVKRAYAMRLRFWEASFAEYPGADTLNNGRLVYEYIITNLLPLWRKCCQCSKWRQIPIEFSFKQGLTKSRFVCS
ncbi:unnamed protein product, partial [Hymenolepis diminuta]